MAAAKKSAPKRKKAAKKASAPKRKKAAAKKAKGKNGGGTGGPKAVR